MEKKPFYCKQVKGETGYYSIWCHPNISEFRSKYPKDRQDNWYNECLTCTQWEGKNNNEQQRNTRTNGRSTGGNRRSGKGREQINSKKRNVNGEITERSQSKNNKNSKEKNRKKGRRINNKPISFYRKSKKV